jgi:excinuclease UvrABC nuclease subunit
MHCYRNLASIPGAAGVYKITTRSGRVKRAGQSNNLRRRLREYVRDGTLTKSNKVTACTMGNPAARSKREKRWLCDLKPSQNVYGMNC